MPFPSVLNSFNRPTTTDRLDSPSHSTLHNTVSSAVGQIEQVIGLSTTSVAGSLFYDIRSPDSNGGGHVQTANKGGTGQTSFTKGDLFVATSSSVISKLAVGVDGQILVANSSVAAGLNWGAGGTRIANSASVITANAITEASLLSITISASTLGTTGAVRATTFVDNYQIGSNGSVLVSVNYSGARVASAVISDTSPIASLFGKITYTLIANNNTAIQRGILEIDLNTNKLNLRASPSLLSIKNYTMNTSSVNSDINQSFGITLKPAATGGDISTDGYIVEKIT